MVTNNFIPDDGKPVSPGECLRQMLKDRGWTQEDLAAITGRSRQQIIDIVSGRRGITPEMAVVLAAAFGNAPSFWAGLDIGYRLSLVNEDAGQVIRRAKLFDLAPLKDMQRRNWIKPTKDMAELEAELKRFFGQDSLDAEPEFPVFAKKTARLADLNTSQRAWCFRAKQMASALVVNPFDPSKLNVAQERLRELAAYPKESRHLPEVMGQAGIRFVVVEPLPSIKMDGAAFWLDDHSPVIAVSLRIDRIDAFWFCVMHEFAHIRHGDGLSVDPELAGDVRSISPPQDEAERRADNAAAAMLVPPEELASFIRRVGPLYAKTRIIQFAHRIKMHPGIIVGQLQYRGEIGYAANREMLPKIRSVVTETALTDGWEKTISPDSL